MKRQRNGIIRHLFRLPRKGREKGRVKIGGITAVLRPLYHEATAEWYNSPSFSVAPQGARKRASQIGDRVAVLGLVLPSRACRGPRCSLWAGGGKGRKPGRSLYGTRPAAGRRCGPGFSGIFSQNAANLPRIGPAFWFISQKRFIPPFPGWNYVVLPLIFMPGVWYTGKAVDSIYPDPASGVSLG